MKRSSLTVYTMGKNRQDMVTMEIMTSGRILRWKVCGYGGN